MQRWTSEPLAIPKAEGAPFAAAEVSFEDLRHDGASFVVRVHLNAPDADEDTAPAARFTVFAHGDCWGDAGHCEVVTDPVSPFDRRPAHPLTPRNLSVDVTDALKALGDVDEVTVTALAFAVDDTAEPLRFGRLTLVTYD